MKLPTNKPLTECRWFAFADLFLIRAYNDDIRQRANSIYGSRGLLRVDPWLWVMPVTSYRVWHRKVFLLSVWDAVSLLKVGRHITLTPDGHAMLDPFSPHRLLS